MRHGKSYRILMTVLGSILVFMGLLLLIVTPITGSFSIGFGILSIVFGRRFGKQVQQTQKGADTQQVSAKYSSQTTVASKSGEKHRVAGTSFRQKAIESLGYPNDEYSYTKSELIDAGMEDERVYRLSFSPGVVSLVEEPDNPHDPNAIKVIIDGVHVGYIKKGSCAHVKKLLRENSIQKVTAEISGGKYKCLESEYNDEMDKEIFTLNSDETDYYVSIKIITV